MCTFWSLNFSSAHSFKWSNFSYLFFWTFFLFIINCCLWSSFCSNWRPYCWAIRAKCTGLEPSLCKHFLSPGVLTLSLIYLTFDALNRLLDWKLNYWVRLIIYVFVLIANLILALFFKFSFGLFSIFLFYIHFIPARLTIICSMQFPFVGHFL